MSPQQTQVTLRGREVSWGGRGVVSRSHADVNVGCQGNCFDGALVGINFGHVFLTSARGSVACLDGCEAGGLVGVNDQGAIDESYSDATVSASDDPNRHEDAGALVRENSGGTVSNSYAFGNATGSNTAGGLCGIE